MRRAPSATGQARIRVAGVGSGGRTAVNGLIAAGVGGVEFLTIDTDAAALRESRAPLHLCLGQLASGAAGDPERGRRAALASQAMLEAALGGADLVFVLAGLAGGTGSGAAPVVAQVAREQGALVIAMVTYPFSFEGRSRKQTAERGIHGLKKWADTLIVIPNDRLIKLADGRFGFHETYRLAHDVWRQSIQGISDVVNRPGLINVDFADVRTIMAEGGAAVIATGSGRGPDRARQAAAQAGHSTLLDITVDGARGMLVKVSGGPDMSLPEVKDAVAAITARAHPGALVIFGAAEDERLRGELSVTVIATGFDRPDRPLLAPKQAPRRPIFGQPSSQPVLQTAR